MAQQIFQAIEGGDAKTARELLLASPDLVQAEKDGDTPIHTAARNAQAGMIILLVEHGADINAQNSDGNTALHLAVMHLHEVRRRVGTSDYQASRTLLECLKHSPTLGINNNIGDSAWDEAFGCDEEQVCFWLEEAERLQKATQAGIKEIRYTITKTDEEVEVQGLEAFGWDGESIVLEPNEISGYSDYLLGRRNWHGGLGAFDDNRNGKLVWDVQLKRVSKPRRKSTDMEKATSPTDKATSPTNFDALLAEVEASPDGIVLSMKDLVTASGQRRAGKLIVQGIEERLLAKGLSHDPTNLPHSQSEIVRLFKRRQEA